jgi:hypothetical protein
VSPVAAPAIRRGPARHRQDQDVPAASDAGQKRPIRGERCRVTGVCAFVEVRRGLGDLQLGRFSGRDLDEDQAKRTIRIGDLAEDALSVREPLHALALSVGPDPADLSGSHRNEHRKPAALRRNGENPLPVGRQARGVVALAQAQWRRAVRRAEE